MGEHKNNFTDGKVLRSQDSALNKRQLRMLLGNLEQGEYDVTSLRRLQTVSTKIETALGEFFTEMLNLGSKFDRALNEYGPNSQEFRDVNISLAAYNREAGDELVEDVVVSMTEYDWIKERWNSNKKLMGTRDIRLDLLAIDAAIGNALGIKLVDKQVWVQGEEAPEPVSIASLAKAE